ncbi:MAG: FAD-dependent oxidoreductase, partial [Erysipelotrichales bacterium]
LGATIKCNVEIGKDISMDDLKKDHDAVLITVGASAAKTIDMFDDNSIVISAIDFLAETKTNKGDIKLPNNVLVIGGGDVAMDAVTTLKLLGVSNVTNVVYEEFEEFRASKKELEGAQEQGVTIIDGYAPQAVKGNKVTFKHRKINSEMVIEPELIILAVGQKVDADSFDLPIENNEVNFEGYQTKDAKVFVSGDIAQGDKTVVWAVRKGKEAAADIHAKIGGLK